MIVEEILDVLVDPALLPLLAAPFAGGVAGALSVRPPVDDVQMREVGCRNLTAPCATAAAAAVAVVLWAAAVVPQLLLWPSCLLGWSLLALALTDWRQMLLPDTLTLPLGLAGVGVTAMWFPSLLVDSVFGAVLGWGVFTALAAGYRRLRGRDGLGGGDAKLLAALGSWLGWQGLPSVVAVAALTGLAVVTGASRVTGRQVFGHDAMPLGSHLALAGWLTWLYGPVLAA